MESAGVRRALEYMEAHLYEPMELETLAKVAGYSPFHFTRIFRREAGETPGRMIKRLRLAGGARMILDGASMTEAAMTVGYDTPSGFTKAFRDLFGCAPTQFRNEGAIRLDVECGKLEAVPEILTLEPVRVLSRRERGGYAQAASAAWKGLLTALAVARIPLAPENRFMAICYDDPNITEEEKIRFEACVVPARFPQTLPEGLAIREIPGGTFAVIEHRGPFEELYRLWNQFYGWAREEKRSLAPVPAMEEHLNHPARIPHLKEEELGMRLYLPLA